MAKDEKLFDVRVSDRYIKEGHLNKKDYESYLKKLPDSEEKSEILVIEEEEELVEETGVEETIVETAEIEEKENDPE